MDLFTSYRLEKEEKGYVIILYMDGSLTEFADELGHLRKEKEKDVYERVQEFILKRFPDIKVKSVRIVLGSMVLAYFPITNLHLREINSD